MAAEFNRFTDCMPTLRGGRPVRENNRMGGIGLEQKGGRIMLYDLQSYEDAIAVLQDAKERQQIMAIIEKIREMGGANTLMVLAGYMMTAGIQGMKKEG
jgi:hypothetical protein